MKTLFPAKLKSSQTGNEIDIPLDLRGLKVHEGDKVVAVGSDTVWRVLVLGEPERTGDKHHRHWIVEKKVK